MITRASPAHAEVMAEIHAVVMAKERWSTADIATLIAQPGAFGFIDPAGGFVLARTAGDEAEILTLAVLPAERRRGRGRALLNAAQAAARASGAVAMFLEVDARNTAARALYADAGYQEVGLRRAYYLDGGDALILRRELTPAATGAG